MLIFDAAFEPIFDKFPTKRVILFKECSIKQAMNHKWCTISNEWVESYQTTTNEWTITVDIGLNLNKTNLVQSRESQAMLSRIFLEYSAYDYVTSFTRTDIRIFSESSFADCVPTWVICFLSEFELKWSKNLRMFQESENVHQESKNVFELNPFLSID